MSTPIRQHFVPQFIIRNFVDAAGWVHGHDRLQPGRGFFRSRPENVFVQRHLYSFRTDDGADPAGERALGHLEDRAAPVIDKILAAVRQRRMPNLSAVERAWWDRFFVTQWKRVPDVRRNVVPDERVRQIFAETAADIVMRHPEHQEELARLQQPEKLAQLVQNARVGSLLLPGGAAQDVIARRGLAFLLIPDSRRSFVLGSRPVVKLGIVGATDMRDPASEMWFAIAPDVAVGPGNEVEAEAGRTLDDPALVRLLNRAIWSQSSAVVARTDRLVRSLVNDR